MPSILLIDDDNDVRLVFVEILFDAGYEVDAVSSFQAGAKVLDGRDYDLVIADVRLPDGTGMGLADSARRRGIPALIVTGDASDPDIDRAKYEVLEKPMKPRLLLTTIDRLLARG